MSELTPCNYCTLKRIKANAKKNGDVVTLGRDEFGWITVHVHKPDIKDPAGKPDVYFKELTDYCCC